MPACFHLVANAQPNERLGAATIRVMCVLSAVCACADSSTGVCGHMCCHKTTVRVTSRVQRVAVCRTTQPRQCTDCSQFKCVYGSLENEIS